MAVHRRSIDLVLKQGGSGGMGRQALLAAAVAGLLAAAAFGVHQAIFTDPSSAPSARPLASTPPAATDARSGTPSARPDGERAVIRTLVGRVERQAPDGSWQPLRVNDEVREDDTIRTAGDAKVGIELGPNVTVEVSEGTEVRIEQITRSLSLVRLADGRIFSAVRGREGSSFRVEAQDSDAVAEANNAEFAMMTRDKGHVAVATTKGEVKLSAKGEAVAVGAGKQSRVTPGTAPSEPTEIPPALFLELGPPPPRRTAADHVTVTGRTSPGAVLNIRGQRRVVTDNRGDFSEVVALQEGENDIVVSVQDVLGRGASETLPRITVDVRVRSAPTTEVTW
jgi:hypothetical protein